MPEEARLERALERLDELVDWERRDRDAGMRRGLEPALDLVRRLGAPHERFRVVHVAGTKGKGTTAALVAAGLVRAGVRVGLYTSPHVDTVRERVAIDGELVGGEQLGAALERALDEREAALAQGSAARDATWFDLMTAAAFVVFAERGVEWAVVECGLGGRLDSTNVVHGEVCIVTNVDLEHTAVLGDSRVRIAYEKGGILEPGSVLVTGLRRDSALDEAEDPGVVLEQLAEALSVRVRRPAQDAAEATILERNVGLARLALDELGVLGVQGARGRPVGASLLDRDALRSARLPGRLERFDTQGVPVVVDSAHVPSSVHWVLRELRRTPQLSERPLVVLALGRDKDAEGVLKALGAHADTVVCTALTTGPLRSAQELAELARGLGLTALAEEDPRRAFRRAHDLARGTTWVLVIGSFYLAGAVRAELREPPC